MKSNSHTFWQKEHLAKGAVYSLRKILVPTDFHLQLCVWMNVFRNGWRILRNCLYQYKLRVPLIRLSTAASCIRKCRGCNIRKKWITFKNMKQDVQPDGISLASACHACMCTRETWWHTTPWRQRTRAHPTHICLTRCACWWRLPVCHAVTLHEKSELERLLCFTSRNVKCRCFLKLTQFEIEIGMVIKVWTTSVVLLGLSYSCRCVNTEMCCEQQEAGRSVAWWPEGQMKIRSKQGRFLGLTTLGAQPKPLE